MVVEAGDKTLAEDLILRAGHAQMMFDVGDGLLKVKGAEVVTDGDPLMEGLIGSEAEELGQVRLAEQDQGESGLDNELGARVVAVATFRVPCSQNRDVEAATQVGEACRREGETVNLKRAGR